jgi:hypothetical protein
VKFVPDTGTVGEERHKSRVSHRLLITFLITAIVSAATLRSIHTSVRVRRSWAFYKVVTVASDIVAKEA